MTGQAGGQVDADRLLYVPFQDAAKPCSGITEVFVDHWWIVHPQRGLTFQTFPPRLIRSRRRPSVSPVCNSDRRIAETFVDQFPAGHEVRLVEIAYFRVKRNGDLIPTQKGPQS